MIYITVGIEEDCYETLRAQALQGRQVIHWQAEALLRQGMGLAPIARPVVPAYVEPEADITESE